MTTLQKKHAALAFAALSLATSLAGCSSTGSDSVEHHDYTDGTYTESGDYTAPSGQETVEVTVTIADNTISTITVTGDATDPQAKLHQGEFIAGISDEVVGVNIDELNVHKVGGSSLTSSGFNVAIAAIKADAAA